MFKYKQKIKIFLSFFTIIIIFSICVYFVQTYSSKIGLFDNIDIKISGNKYINSQYIKSDIYPQLNSSLLSINLIDIQNKLESIDYIEAVQISRILPRTLMIHIIERSPILLMNKSDDITFMDINGVLLPADKKSIGTFPVPVLSILDENDSLDKYTEDIVHFFQFLIDEYPHFYKNLSEVKIQKGVWEFFSDNNTKIYANDTYLTNQLTILKTFEKTVHPKRNLQDYRYIDLRIKNQVIVKEKYRKG